VAESINDKKLPTEQNGETKERLIPDSFDDAISLMSALAYEMLKLQEQLKSQEDTPSDFQTTSSLKQGINEIKREIERVIKDYDIAMAAIHKKALGLQGGEAEQDL
jgi:hypothetical protein